MRPRTLTLVLAGGKGTRLYPLTKYRAKPAVPVFGKYRIIDFVLSNLVNSGFFSIYILTQYKVQSLADHIEQGWQFGPALRSRDFFISLAPAQMWVGEHWYKGTADAVYQNLHLIATFDADEVLIFSADHIYKMDISQMLQWHRLMSADLTVAVMKVKKSEAHNFGILKVNSDNFIVDFVEKPKENIPVIPDDPEHCYASMGNYIFKRDVLEKALIEDAQDPNSTHDFGRAIIPTLVKSGYRVSAYNFHDNKVPGETKPYWRDVGTIYSYWQSHMESLIPGAGINLYNPRWPIRTVSFRDPPALITTRNGHNPELVETLVAEGVRVYGAKVRHSVLGRGVVVEEGAEIEESIIFYGVKIGRGAKLKRVIVDKRIEIPPNTEIGFDQDLDIKRGYFVEENGIVVVPAVPPKLRTLKTWPLEQND